MLLDTTTLLLVTCIITAILGGAQFLVWWSNREIASMRYWSLSMLLVLMAFILFVPVASRPGEKIWPVLSNLAVSTAYMTIWAGIRVFIGRKPWSKSALIAVVLYMCAMFALIQTGASIHGRILLQSPLIAAFSFLCARDLLTLPENKRDPATIAVGSLLIFHMLFYLARIWAAARIVFYDAPPQSDLLVQFTFLQSSMVIVATGIGFLVMTTTRLQTQLRQQATTDALTGIRNRRWFIEHAEREFSRARRNQSPLSIVVIDIDHFKKVNDMHGHIAGDILLKAVAAALSEGLRSTDMLCRWGGEEFCVLLSDTPAQGAQAMLDRLRLQIAALEIHHQGKTLTATISVGIAQTSTRDASLDDTIARADHALYAAKNTGRNRVTVAHLHASRILPSV